MKIKDGVSEVGLKIEMRIVKVYAGKIWAKHGQICVMTSGTEYSPKRLDGSLHPFGYGTDYRTSYFSTEEKHIVALELKAELGKDYDVVEKKDHIHVEYDAIFRGQG